MTSLIEPYSVSVTDKNNNITQMMKTTRHELTAFDGSKKAAGIGIASGLRRS